MTDRPLGEGAFEHALRATLQDLAPATPPTSLRTAVAAVALRRRTGFAARSRTLLAAVGMAAAIVVAVAGVGLVSGLRLPDGGVSPVGTPPPVSPSPRTNTFTYRVVTSDGSLATKVQVGSVGDVMSARLAAYGLGTFSSFYSDDRITVELPTTIDAGSRDAIRTLLGMTGRFSIGQPVTTPPAIGESVAGAPLLTADAIKGAQVGSDQTGNPTVEITLTPAATTVFAATTSAHIGDYLPIALDGRVFSAPVIMDAIPNGDVQIQLASDQQLSAASLAAILQSGPLPLPVEEAATP
jgi:hypothetical protein